MDELYMGTIFAYGFQFAPQGWAHCSGQLLSVSNYATLFGLLGTRYGGNGVTNFGLPDMQGRQAIGMGQSAEGTNYAVGQKGGSNSVAFSAKNLPPHTHDIQVQMKVSSMDAQSSSPRGNYLTSSSAGSDYATTPTDGAFAGATAGVVTTPTGIGKPDQVKVQQPYLNMNYCICISGVFPKRP